MNALCEFIGDSATLNLDEIDGKAALFHAAEYDCPDVIREVSFKLIKGLDLDLTDKEGKTTMFMLTRIAVFLHFVI